MFTRVLPSILLLLCGSLFQAAQGQQIGQADPDFGAEGTQALIPSLGAESDWVRVSPGGRQLITYVSGEKTLYLWRLSRSQAAPTDTFSLPARIESVQDVIFLPEGGYLLLAQQGEKPLIIQLTVQGDLDARFGQGGMKLLDLGTEATAIKGQIDREGRLWIAGHGQKADGNRFLFAVRLRPDGRLDRAFGHGGHRMLTLSGQEVCQDARLDAQGGFILGAETRSGNFTQFAAIRLSDTGQPDPHWGQQGKVLLAPGDEHAFLRQIQPLADGSLILAGHARTGTGFSPVLYRLTPQGRPDPRVDAQGYRTYSAGPNAYLQAVLQQPDGNLLLAGTSHYRPFLIRIDEWGRRDRTFGRDGIQHFTDLGGCTKDRILSLGLSPDGQILMAGRWADSLQLAQLRGNPPLAGLAALMTPPGESPQAASWELQLPLSGGKSIRVAGNAHLVSELLADGHPLSAYLQVQLGQQMLLVAEEGHHFYFYINGKYAGRRPVFLWEARHQALVGK
ncbi:MAG: hypothetical protein D6722_20230 [Bacteroidetes bacterium]|nr:MAG: hypothetical protein D6722_20230 [Bacteroidota bacterium]